MERQETIRDVARLAGVSVATASRVLSNNNYPVSAQLRQRVKDAARTLNYVPNALAKSLRQSVSRDVGVVVPSISNPFYLHTLLGIDEVLSKNGCSIILCNTMRDVEYERACLRQLFERQVKGILLSSVDTTGDAIREYTKRGMRFVLLDQMIGDLESPGINFDTCAGAKLAVQYLAGQGHRRIAFATMPLSVWTRVETHRGYQEALATCTLPYDPSIVYEYPVDYETANNDLDLSAGEYVAEAFLRDGCPATAILCINDMVAIGLIKTLQKSGVRVPDDVSVVGFDDIPFASAFIPSLTTIRYPAAETGRLAALMLVDSLGGTSAEMPLTMNLAPKLIRRDSVRCLL